MLHEGIVNGAINFLTDLMILAIPMPLVWKLQADLWRRLSLAFTFLLGSFVVFASIYRFYSIFTFIPGDVTCTAPLNPPPPPPPGPSGGVGRVRGVSEG